MGCRVIFTPRSQADLRDILSYISRDSTERAQAFGKTLVEKAHSIGDFPEKGQVVPEVGDPSLRQIVHGKYRIIYKFIPNPPTVFVIRFWHGARGEPEIAGLF